jgi:hypothetical protein
MFLPLETPRSLKGNSRANKKFTVSSYTFTVAIKQFAKVTSLLVILVHTDLAI